MEGPDHGARDDDRFAEAVRLYDEGLFVEALAAFLSLAEQGDHSSMTRVAIMYGAGEGGRPERRRVDQMGHAGGRTR